MMRPAHWLTLALACALPPCSFGESVANAGHAASATARARPALHYRTAGRTFEAPHASWRDGDPPPRQVAWSYPVLVGPDDPATAALNAWIRRQSLELLLGDDKLVDQAVPLNDEQVAAFAAGNRDFIETELDQAEIQISIALGIYRTFTFFTEVEGGAHPSHGLTTHLYDVRLGRERRVQDLFKPDESGDLAELYDQQNKSDAHPCEQFSFDWDNAALGARDTIYFEYPYRPGWDVECQSASVHGPKVARLLKSPRDLVPRFDLVPDKR